MNKRPDVDEWEQVGRELRYCDPVRYIAVLRAAEQIVSIYRDTTFGVLPASVVPRNDNR